MWLKVGDAISRPLEASACVCWGLSEVWGTSVPMALWWLLPLQ